MNRIVVVEDVTIFASQGHLQRSHSGHLRIVLVRRPGRALVCNPSIARYKKTIATDSSLVSSGHDRKASVIIDNFQFAANKVLKIIFAMFIMFPSGGFLKI